MPAVVPCQRCGKAVPPKEGFPNLCDDCYVALGSCCNEWEPQDDDPANAEFTEDDA